jgi:L-threonylcarbamoyladenylate synthase
MIYPSDAIDWATQALTAGQLIGLPTETVYGLAGHALRPETVARIYEVKNRPTFNPLIVHAGSAGQAFRHASRVPSVAQLLAEAFWPGPLTLILPKTPSIPEIVTAGSSWVALRVPEHPVALEILQRLDFPVVAPSANPSGYISPTTALHVETQLGQAIAGVLDGGACSIGLESTIVWIQPTDPLPEIRILRFGAVTPEAIRQVIPETEAKLVLPGTASSNSTSTPVIAPGQLTSHYAPLTPLVLADTWPPPLETGTAYLGWTTIPGPGIVLAPQTGTLTEAAQHLFSALRLLDDIGYLKIVAQQLPEEGIGRAINDRLRRAAA